MANTENKPVEFITFRGALYRVALQAPIRGPGLISLPSEPSRAIPRHRPHPFSPQQDPSRMQARKELKQEILKDIDGLLHYLAAVPVGPADLRDKFDKFSSGISVMTDQAQQPLYDGLKGLAAVFRKLFKAKAAIEQLQF